VETGVQTTLSPSTLVYTNVEPVNPIAVNTNVSTLGGPIRDFGPSYYAGAASVSAAPGTTAAVSLGEVAARLKGARPTQNVRNYTNADVQRINENMSLQGVNVNARLQQSAQPTTPGITVANGQPASSSAQVTTAPPAQAPNQQPQLSASARPSPSIREGQAQSVPSSSASAATQSPQESNATTPQVNQPKPGTQSGQESSRQLPATSTLLPLLGIIGLASGGIGLVFRKYRK
jgi:hypothetical protein